jgi:hypothetical protein
LVLALKESLVPRNDVAELLTCLFLARVVGWWLKCFPYLIGIEKPTSTSRKWLNETFPTRVLVVFACGVAVVVLGFDRIATIISSVFYLKEIERLH